MDRARVWPAIVSLALCGVTLAPLVRAPDADSFPLSTYPMFAVPRARVQAVDYAVGVTATGATRTLTPALVGSTEVLQAHAVLARAIHGPPSARAALCAAIAARVAGDPAYGDVTAIRLVHGVHDAVDYVVHHRGGHELELARCAVPRRGS